MFHCLLRQSSGGQFWQAFNVTNSEALARETLQQEQATRSRTNFRLSSLEIVNTGAFSGRVLTARPVGRNSRIIAFLVSTTANPFELPLEEKCPHQECPPSICLHYSKFLKYRTSPGSTKKTRNEFLKALQITLIKLKISQ